MIITSGLLEGTSDILLQGPVKCSTPIIRDWLNFIEQGSDWLQLKFRPIAKLGLCVCCFVSGDKIERTWHLLFHFLYSRHHLMRHRMHRLTLHERRCTIYGTHSNFGVLCLAKMTNLN